MSVCVPSVEGPHLHGNDVEVVLLREAAVVEGVAGLAAAAIQRLVQPQAEVAAVERSVVIIVYYHHLQTYGNQKSRGKSMKRRSNDESYHLMKDKGLDS